MEESNPMERFCIVVFDQRRNDKFLSTRGGTRGLAGAVATPSIVDSFKYLYKYLYS
jgi:hypothetical protein